MNYVRTSFGCCSTNDYIFTVGGYNQSKRQALDFCEFYDIKKEIWVELANLPVPTYSLGLGIFD